ncbi:MAG: hypothetical protein COX14_00225 [Chloroflexi bacterium CG23_combo_of_CG06-09_8_20_14_all_45_10]|nr:MAG: hypothetical protein COX14_00225 [Chloroflexi bacterium CG23_combo_of_CG06-09_8_20_14_all_45_10]
MTFASHSENDTHLIKDRGKDRKRLLFIKSPFLISNPSRSNIEFYLERTKEIINRDLPKIADGGFIVIQTQDVRIDGYVEPLAKKVIDLIISDNLWLKEIVIITKEGQISKVQPPTEYLKINHQYLLVYEKTKEDTNG